MRGRIQQFEISPAQGGESLRVFNLHLPYDLAKLADPSALITFAQRRFHSHTDQPVLAVGDFNVYPRKVANGLKGVSLFLEHRFFGRTAQVDAEELVTSTLPTFNENPLNPSLHRDIRCSLRWKKSMSIGNNLAKIRG